MQSNKQGNQPKERRKRLPLSCGECRKQKLSCDRAYPCRRCVRKGRQHLCVFETHQRDQQQQQEVSSQDKVSPQQQYLATSIPAIEPTQADPRPRPIDTYLRQQQQQVDLSAKPEQPSLHPRIREAASGYYARHTLFRYFHEIPELFPFIGETTEEWLKPNQVYLKKIKPLSRDSDEPVTKAHAADVASFSALLPPRDITDSLIKFYLDHFEQIHRVIHVPTFKKDYGCFWDPSRRRSLHFHALILSMLAMSACASPSLTDSSYRTMPVVWLSACDKWLKQQSFKSRKLIYYQVACLSYFAKRMNMINKKRYWAETGALVQDALIDGLDSTICSHHDTPFQNEMKRRIWHVLRELDLHNCYEYGLPTMFHNVDPDMRPPANVDDLSFRENSLLIPVSKPSENFTRTSYQSHAADSWHLRLEVSRRLFSPASSASMTYDEVLDYPHKLMQAIDILPNWTSIPTSAYDDCPQPLPILANTFLQVQLKECILALHRGFLGKGQPKHSMSENIYYQVARDMLVLNQELGKLGLQSILQIREDLLLGSLSLTRVTLLQPLNSTNLIAANADATLALMEACLEFMAARYSRSCNNEPWCFVTMCATIMVLKVHLGKELRRNAKYLCATRFIDLHEKYSAKASTSPPSAHQQATPQSASTANGDVHGSSMALEVSEEQANPEPNLGWLDDSALSYDLDLDMDFDLDFHQAWQEHWSLL